MSLSPSNFDDYLKIGTLIVSSFGFAFAVFTWRKAQEKALQERREAADRVAEQRRVEAQKPFLQKQMELYLETVQVVTKLSLRPPRSDKLKLEKRFYELYYGELALVENREIEKLMIKIKNKLEGHEIEEGFRDLSLKLTNLVRSSLDKSWGVKVWTES